MLIRSYHCPVIILQIMTQGIKIVQWNARNFKHKLNELLLRSQDTDIFLISESWLDFRDTISVRGFDVIRSDRIGCRGGGVLILVRSSIKYSILNNIPDCRGGVEICGISIYTEFGKISLIALYRPPDGPTINSLSWNNFFSYFQGNFIIGGDFNLPHDRIIPLQEGISDLDIILLNDDSFTYFKWERNYSSILDLSSVNSSLGLSTSWSVNDDPWSSDHFPIFININVRAFPKIKYKNLLSFIRLEPTGRYFQRYWKRILMNINPSCYSRGIFNHYTPHLLL